MKTNFLLSVAILIFTATLVSCSNDDENRLPFLPGNANVTSKTVTFTHVDYVPAYFTLQVSVDGAQNTPSKKVRIEDPALTSDVYNNGVVLVYTKDGSDMDLLGDAWAPLPLRFLSMNHYYINYGVRFLEGAIEIHYYHEANDNNTNIPPVGNILIPTRTYKYVILSGAAAVAAKAGKLDPAALIGRSN